MDNEDNVYIDVTHGFRSMPMLYIPVIKYTEAIKNINLKAIYYGAYEVKEEKKPIFDLAIYKEILDWAFGSKNFIQYGISKDLLKTSRNRKMIKIMNKDKSYMKSNHFVENLNTFADCIQTGRGNEFTLEPETKKLVFNQKTESIRSEYNKLEKFDYDSILFPVLLPLIENIKASISEFAQEGNTALGVATVHWCRDKGMIQQGYTALEETIKSFACDLCGYKNEIDKFIRDDLIGSAMVYCKKLIDYADVHNEEKYVYYKENQCHFYDMILKYGWEIPEGRDDEFKKVLEIIPYDLAELSFSVKDIRNDINHFGMRGDSLKPASLMDNFNNQVAKFDAIYGGLKENID
jgi:CRISPR-associated DxTHG motif protein